MNRQWHPLFAHLLSLLVKDFYEVRPEVPVSELPRAADLLLLRRHAGPPPPFEGVWSHLREWNVLEFKGPTDHAEEHDLELLMHVGTGLTYRLNQEQLSQGAPPLENHQVALWYLAPKLGETFLGYARSRAFFEFESRGLWRGGSWGHPVWLLDYGEVPVEVDTIPLHLLAREPGPPALLGEVVLGNPQWFERFAMWLSTLQPGLWKEMRQMVNALKRDSIIDWEAVGEITDLGEVVRLLPAERVIEILGVERAIEAIGLRRTIETIGLPSVIEAVGLPSVIEAVGLPSVIEAVGAERVLDELFATVPAEQLREMLRRRQQGENPKV